MPERETEQSSVSAFESLLAEAARASSIPLSSLSVEPRLSFGEALFGQRFTIQHQLGAGGTGVTYAAFDRERDRVVALKLLSRADPVRILRFKSEFRSLADTVHPNLVRLHDLFTAQGRWFFTMDLVRGRTFDRGFEALDRDDPRGLAARHEQLRGALRQLSEGVGALHRIGKVHRDLKPSNVLIAENGHVTIVDFGLVIDQAALLDGVADVVGTPGYISPEQLHGAAASPASDWYAVGVMLHEALTGRRPYTSAAQRAPARAREQRAHAPPAPLERLDLPPDLVEICHGLLRDDPAQRFGADAVRSRLACAAARLGADDERIHLRIPRFVGRQRELGKLEEAWSAARSGVRVACRVHGPSGIGKTALIREFLERVRRDDRAIVLSGRCYEREFTPYKLIDGVMDSLVAHLVQRPLQPERAGASPASGRGGAARKRLVGEPLEQEPEEVWPLWAALARLFPTLDRVDFVARASAAFDPTVDAREQRRRASEGLRRALRLLSRMNTLIVHVDDAQWTDADGAGLWSKVLEDAPPLLFVVNHRSDEDNPHLQSLFSRLAGAGHDTREISLGGLDDAEVRELTRCLSGDGHAGQPDVIAREAHGSPYFALELARYALHTPQQGGGPSQSRLVAESVTLERALLARARALPGDVRSVLELVALAGVPLPRQVLAAACSSLDLDRALAILRQESFLRARAEKSRELADTYHDRVRESVIAQLDAAQRKAAHGRLASALEASAPEQVELLSTHFAAAGHPERAAHYAWLAGRRAASALAFEQASVWFREALVYPLWKTHEMRRIASELGDVLAASGYSSDAADAYLRAANAAGSERSVFELQAAGQLLCSGQIQKGIEQLRNGLHETSAPLPARAGTLATSVLGNKCWNARKNLLKPRPVSALRAEDIARVDAFYWASLGLFGLIGGDGLTPYMLLRQLWEALRLREPVRMVRAVQYVAAMIVRPRWSPLGLSRSVLLRLSRAAEQQLDDPRIEFWQHFRLAWQAYWTFDEVGVMRHWHAAQRSLAQGACYGVEREIALLRMLGGWGALHQGDMPTYLRSLEELQNEARDRRDEHAAAFRELTDMRDMLDGNFEARVARIDAVLARYRGSAPLTRLYHAELESLAAAAERACGREHAAWARLQRLSATFRASLAWSLSRMRAAGLAEGTACALSLAARSSEKRELLARAAAMLRQNPAPADWLLALRAGLAWQRGQRAAALRHLEAAAADPAGRLGFWVTNSARIARGLALGGAAGDELVRAGEQALRAAGAKTPRRWARMHIPGIPIPD